ncbi:MAG: hypothetical protein FWF55_01680, partial [Treponema sp.]|nr:hypothetical protein [Treponema sp.]
GGGIIRLEIVKLYIKNPLFRLSGNTPKSGVSFTIDKIPQKTVDVKPYLTHLTANIISPIVG